MISKEVFVGIMYRLENLERNIGEVDEALHNLSPDFGGFGIPEAVDITLDLLREIFDDQDELLEYFVYELDFLNKFKPGDVIDADGNPIDLSTWGQVYDFLIDIMEDTNE